MQTQRTVDGKPSPDSTPVRLPLVPQRSARRATTRRASGRRATARARKDDVVDGRIVEYLDDHPQSTTGDIAKGLNANRGTIAVALSRIVRARDVTTNQAVE